MHRGVWVAALVFVELFASAVASEFASEAAAQPAAGAAEPELRAGRTPRPRESVLQLSGEISLKAIEAMVRQRVPAKKRWRAKPYTHPINGGAGTVDGISIGYDIVTGTAVVTADRGGRIVTTIPVGYSVWARYQAIRGGPVVDASCINRTAHVILTTTLSVRDTKLAPSTQVSIAAGTRCVVTALQIDVTDQLTEVIGERLQEVAGDVDREVADSLKLDAAAAILWRRLLAPFKTPGGWLDLDPRSVQIGPVAVKGNALRATQQVIARSALRVDKPSPRATSMPSIDSGTSAATVSLLVEVAVGHKSLDSAASAATKSIAGVGRVQLRPRGRLVAVGAKVKAVGQVWMTGELSAPGDDGTLAIRELRWTAESKRMLGAKALPLKTSIASALKRAVVTEFVGLRARAQDALVEGLSAVPLLRGAAAIDRISFASAVREQGGVRMFFRAEGTSLEAARCHIRQGAAIHKTDTRCTKDAIAATCKRPCEYSTDGKTWLRAR